MIPVPRVWLKERGWVELDIPSGLRWQSPHNNVKYTTGSAMHIERFLIRSTLADLSGWDEEAKIKERKDAKKADNRRLKRGLT